MPAKTQVKDIMTEGVYSVTVDDTLKKADDIMKKENIRHIPVVEGSRFAGLITRSKVMEYSLREYYDPESNFGEDVFNKIIDFEDLMERETHVIYPEDSTQKAIKLMAKYGLDCLPVVDWDMNLKGLLTFTDVLLFIHSKIEKGEFDN